MRRITLAEAILALVVILAVPVLWGAAAETRALFPVQKQGKYGFIDRTGKIAIEPRFESAGGFFEGRALVQEAGKWGYIDKQGKMVIPPKFNTAWPFEGGLGEVIQGETEGYIDKTGKFVWPHPN